MLELVARNDIDSLFLVIGIFLKLLVWEEPAKCLVNSGTEPLMNGSNFLVKKVKFDGSAVEIGVVLHKVFQ